MLRQSRKLKIATIVKLAKRRMKREITFPTTIKDGLLMRIRS
ncbi:unnamed protein product [Enterobius vermicularis]|uniref:Uncharacterized protein n=1 Tax=Enterobius vermicularis TaxID=51028 RepID=A0A0N4VEJ2_ENTVE|nr:unnamed protein product [Enterobius vermicularis]